MAELKWEKDDKGDYRAASTSRLGGSAMVGWVIKGCKDGRREINYSDVSLSDVVGGHDDCFFPCPCQAKAACQAAEDRILQEEEDARWPKYTRDSGGGAEHGGVVFDKWISAKEYKIYHKDGYTHPHTVPSNYERHAWRAIPEEEALSRIVKPKPEKKLKLMATVVDNIVLGYVKHMDESLRAECIDYTVDGFTIMSSTRPQLVSLDRLFIRGVRESRDNDFFAHAFDSDSDAEATLKKIKACVSKINRSESTTDTVDTCGNLEEIS